MTKIYYWDKIIGDPVLRRLFKDYLDLLLAGDYQTADLDLKTIPGHKIYSIRINREDRLLFTTVDGCILVLELIKNHDYQKSRFLKPQVLKNFLNKNVKAIDDEINGRNFEATTKIDGLEKKQPKDDKIEYHPVEFFNNSFFQLTEEQESAVQAKLPALIIGSAGTGKSVVAKQLFNQLTGRILYVAESENLVNKMREQWLASPESHSANPPQVTFLSYAELLRSQLSDVAATDIVGKKYFDEWFNLYTSDTKCPAKDADELYQEFRLVSICVRLEDYEAKGKRQSIFQHPEQRAVIWNAYQRYAAYLEKAKKVDPAFCRVPMNVKYDNVIVDEAPDLSLLQLKQLLEISAGNNLVACWDPNQNLANNKSLLSEFVNIVQDRAERKMDIVYLNKTFRCAPAVVRVAKAILQIKEELTGGVADKNGYQDINVAENISATDGIAEWVDPNNLTEAQKRLVIEAGLSPDVVIVTTEEHMKEARDYFKTPLVFDVRKVKGLEYKKVIAYKTFSQKIFQEASSLLIGNDPLARKAKHRAKAGVGDTRFEIPFNELFTICTRAKSEFYLWEEPEHKTKQLRELVTSVMKRDESKTEKNVVIDSGAKKAVVVEPIIAPALDHLAWLSEAARQEAAGNIEQARDIYLKLGIQVPNSLVQPSDKQTAIKTKKKKKKPQEKITPESQQKKSMSITTSTTPSTYKDAPLMASAPLSSVRLKSIDYSKSLIKVKEIIENHFPEADMVLVGGLNEGGLNQDILFNTIYEGKCLFDYIAADEQAQINFLKANSQDDRLINALVPTGLSELMRRSDGKMGSKVTCFVTSNFGISFLKKLIEKTPYTFFNWSQIVPGSNLPVIAHLCREINKDTKFIIEANIDQSSVTKGQPQLNFGHLITSTYPSILYQLISSPDGRDILKRLVSDPSQHETLIKNISVWTKQGTYLGADFYPLLTLLESNTGKQVVDLLVQKDPLLVKKEHLRLVREAVVTANLHALIRLSNYSRLADIRVDDGGNLLHFAAGSGKSLPVLKYLCTLPGFNVNAINARGYTPLAYALRANDAAMVTFLKSQGATTKYKISLEQCITMSGNPLFGDTSNYIIPTDGFRFEVDLTRVPSEKVSALLNNTSEATSMHRIFTPQAVIGSITPLTESKETPVSESVVGNSL